MRHLGTNLVTYMQHQNSENYIMLLNKGDLNKWREILCPWIGRDCFPISSSQIDL